jgi:hypothetical protein
MVGLVAYQRNDFPTALDAFKKAEKIALHVKDLVWVQARLDETRHKIAGEAGAGNRKK